MTLSQWALHGIIDGTLALAVAGLIWLLAGRKLSPRFGAWLFGLAMLKGAVPLPLEIAWQPATQIQSVVLNESLPAFWNTVTEASTDSVTQPDSMDQSLFVKRVWCFAVILGIMRFSWLCLRTHRLRKTSVPWSGGESWGVECRTVTGLHAPALTGLLTPVILLPEGLDQKLNADQMRWVIAHEVAHARAGDLVWELLTNLLRTACFFNLALWIASLFAARLRELAADEEALYLSGVSRQESASGFVSLIEWAKDRPELLLAGAGMSSAGREAYRRVQALTQLPGRRLKKSTQFIIAFTTLGLALPSYRFGHAQIGDEVSRIFALERRIAELEMQLKSKSRLDQLRERAASRAHARSVADEASFNAETLREIERLYQSAKHQTSRAAIAAGFAPLMERFPQSNRAGCAALLLARLSKGEERTKLLLRAASKHADDYFLDGTSVGGVARLMLAQDATDPTDASKWKTEIQADYADELDFGAVPLLNLLQTTPNQK